MKKNITQVSKYIINIITIIFNWLIWLFITILCLITILVIFPVPLPLTDIIKNNISEPAKLEIASVTLSVNSNYFIPHLQLNRVNYQSPTIDFTLEKLGVGISFKDLIKGEVKVSNIVLDGLVLNATLTEDNDITFSIIKEPSNLLGSQTPDFEMLPDTSEKIQSVLNTKGKEKSINSFEYSLTTESLLSRPFASLNRVILSNITLIFTDFKNDKKWDADIIKAEVSISDTNELSINANTKIEQQGVVTGISSDIKYNLETKNIKGLVIVNNLPTDYIVQIAKTFIDEENHDSLPGTVGMYISMATNFDANLSNAKIKNLEFNLNLGSGYLSHGIFASPLEISSISMNGKYRQDLEQILIPKFEMKLAGNGEIPLKPLNTSWFIKNLNGSIVLDKNKILLNNAKFQIKDKATGSLDIGLYRNENQDMTFQLSAEAKNVRKDLAMVLWPNVWGADSHAWASANLQSGFISRVTTNLEISIPNNGTAELTKLEGIIDTNDMAIKYLDGMPLAFASKAIATYDLDTFNVDFNNISIYGSNINGENGKLKIESALVKKQSHTFLTLDLNDIRYDLSSMLKFLNNKPLSLLSSANIDTDSYYGKILSDNLHLKFDLTAGTLIKVENTGTFSEVGIKNVLFDQPLKYAFGTFNINTNGMQIKGKGNYEDIDLDIEYNQTWFPKDYGVININAVTDVAKLKFIPLRTNIIELFKGTSELKVEYILTNGDIDISLDLKNTAFNFAPFTVNKNDGTPMSLNIIGNMQSDRFTIKNINTTTQGLNLSASVDIDNSKNITDIVIEKLEIDNDTNLKGTMKLSEDKVFISLDSSKMNVNKIFGFYKNISKIDDININNDEDNQQTDTESISNINKEQNKDFFVSLNIYIAQAILGNNIPGTNLSLSADISNQSISKFSLLGFIDGESISGELQENNEIQLKVRNIGKAFRAFNITSLISQGQGDIIIKPLSISPLSFITSIKLSRFSISNYTFRNGQLDAKLDKDIFTITKFEGDDFPLKGVFSGYIDFNKNYMDIKGSLGVIGASLLSTSLEISGEPSNPRVNIFVGGNRTSNRTSNNEGTSEITDNENTTNDSNTDGKVESNDDSTTKMQPLRNIGREILKSIETLNQK